jgi:putative oxidoreductase
MFRKLIATSSTLVTIPLRLGLGIVMIAHGGQKVLGLWGGPGFKAFTAGTTPFNFMKPTWLWLGAAALSELVGGALVALGFLTRIGAFFIACTMLTAIAGIHWPHGLFAATGGYEYPLTILAIALALLISGGGQASIDKALSSGGGGRRR